MKPNVRYSEYLDRLQKVADLSFAESVLSWDQQVYMPPKGAQHRGRQMATLKAMSHELFVDPKFGSLLEELENHDSLNETQRQNIKLSRRDFLRKKKYPSAFVEEQARVCANAFGAWQEARSKKNFETYRPHLERIVELKRQETQLVGFEHHPYEALLEDYEPGLTVKKLDAVFSEVREQLFPFYKSLLKKPSPRHDFLSRHYPKSKQWVFAERAVAQIGYDFQAGRADDAPHPFCTTFGAGDVRITLRSDEYFFNMMFFAAIHEAGHGLYEQGIPLASEYGTPLGQAVSLAFHESQSRFWENNIARSLPYWKEAFPRLKHEFAENMRDVSDVEMFKAVNLVEPSFIRVEADELTYHGHIYIRYLVERALIEGQIQVQDLPTFWNDLYEEVLGIRPSNDSEGCLQDVHWAYGAFGYFPTYSLGSFYAAQLEASLRKQVPHLDREIESGNLGLITHWLRENVHQHGRRFSSAEILTRVTGSDLKFEYFMSYARKKYEAIYS